MNLQEDIESVLQKAAGTHLSIEVVSKAILVIVEKHYNERPSGLVAVRECTNAMAHFAEVGCSTCKNTGRIVRDLSIQDVIKDYELAVAHGFVSDYPWHSESGERVEVNNKIDCEYH